MKDDQNSCRLIFCRLINCISSTVLKEDSKAVIHLYGDLHETAESLLNVKEEQIRPEV